jgi:hypothetical protein
VIVFSSVLSSTQRQQIEGYLAWKWGLQTNLPSSHPYRQTPIYALPPFPLVPKVDYGTNRQLFLPSQITGCMLWLDGADPNNTGTPPTNGSTVSTWTDKSGNSRNFSGGVSPSYVRNGLNNKGIVRFSSGNYLVSGAVPLFSSSSSGGSFFFIFQTTNNEGQKFLLTYQNQVSGTYCQTESEIGIDTGNTTGSGNFGIHRGCSYASIAPANTIANSTFYMMGLLLLTTGNSPDNVNIYQNGNSLTVSNDNIGYYSAGSYPSANNSRSLVLGARSLVGASGPDGFITGDIAEVIWFSGPLSTTQRQQIEGYLAWKWGLQANLPSTHPYKQAPTYTLSPFPLVPAVTRSTGKAFDPTKISGCQLWFDAADKSTLSITGSNITEWRDKSSNAYSIAQATTNRQPFYITNTQNKLPGVQLATSRWIFTESSNIPNFTTSSATSVFIAARNGSTGTGYNAINSVWLSGASALTTRYQLYFDRATDSSLRGPNLYLSGSFRLQNTTNAVPASTAGVVGFMASSSSILLSVNGNTSTTTGAAPTSANDGTYFQFGDSRGISTLSSDVMIFEMVGFSVVLTIYQRQEIEGYLAWKWGLQSSLPQTHPWKLFPPPPN